MNVLDVEKNIVLSWWSVMLNSIKSKEWFFLLLFHDLIYKHKAGQKFFQVGNPRLRSHSSHCPSPNAPRGVTYPLPVPVHPTARADKAFSRSWPMPKNSEAKGICGSKLYCGILFSPPAAPLATMPLEIALGRLPCTGTTERVSLLWPLPAAPAFLCSTAVAAWLHLPAVCTGEGGEKGFSTLFPPPLHSSSVRQKKPYSLYCHIMCFEKTRGARVEEVS